MLKVWGSLLLTLLALASQVHLVQSQNDTAPTSTEPCYVTEDLTEIWEGAMHEQYELSLNAYEWDVLLMLYWLDNYDNTQILFCIDTDLLLVSFPYPKILELPSEVLIHHGICEYFPVNSSCEQRSDEEETDYNVTCVYPLVETEYRPNPVSESSSDTLDLSNCGLHCDAGGLVYGLSDAEQKTVDLFKIVLTCICFPAIVFIQINQILDQRNTNEKFWNKPILYHCPYLITFFTFLILFMMTLGEIAGKDTITCSDDDSFSFFNPIDGENASCTINGLIFYIALMSYISYTVLLAFAIFRQFYRPLKPWWSLEKWQIHCIVPSIVMILVVISIGTSSVSGVEPMGVCLPGPGDKEALFWLMVMPFLLATVAVACLLCGTLYLMRRNIQHQRKVTNNTQTVRNVADLARRMMWYTLGVLFTMILLTITGFRFYVTHDRLKDAMSDEIDCEITKYYTDLCFGFDYGSCERGFSISPFWFISWCIASASAIASQLVLSCHSATRRRLTAAKDGMTSQLRRGKTVVQMAVGKEKSVSGGKTRSTRKTHTILADEETPGLSPRENTVTKSGQEFQTRLTVATSTDPHSAPSGAPPSQDTETSFTGDKDGANTEDALISNQLTAYETDAEDEPPNDDPEITAVPSTQSLHSQSGGEDGNITDNPPT